MTSSDPTQELSEIATPGAPAAIGPYAQAVRSGNFLFTSGQIALRPDGTLSAASVEAETRQVLDNLAAVLEAGGSDPSRVIRATVYLTDLNDFQLVNAVYGEFFGGHKPARSTVQVAALPKGARVEIDLMATTG